MPVDTHHPEYAAMIPIWRSMRDASIGLRAVRAASTRYLPVPAGMQGTQDVYQAYLWRAKWYGATARTVGGLAGAVLRKEPTVEAPDEMLEHLRDITLMGQTLGALAGMVLEDVLLLGRCGVLIDLTRGDAAGQPMWSYWPTERITNWLTREQDGRDVLMGVVLCESYYAPRSDDPFWVESKERYRLHWVNPDGVYEIVLYEQVSTRKEWVPVSSVIPTRLNVPLDFLPFQFFGPNHLSHATSKPVLEDLVHVNYTYWRHSADYEHGLHLTALPTGIITGYQDETVELLLGSQVVWQIPRPGARVHFLEFQGAGLSSHVEAMRNDKEEMASLGARMLDVAPGVAETLGAVQMRHSGEQSVLASLAMNVSGGLSRCLRWHAWWARASESPDNPDIRVALNTDFVQTALGAQEITALMGAWQAGGMSLDTFLWNLAQGERLPPGDTVEEEKKRIEAERAVAEAKASTVQAQMRPPAEEEMDEEMRMEDSGNGAAALV